MKALSFLLLFFCTLTFTARAQNGYANNWYFGQNCAITFNNGSPPQSIRPSSINTSEGCSTISDAAGQLLFYTDGLKTWNKNNQQMPNGHGLLGDPSSTQSALIVPDPASTDRFYIFAAGDGGTGGLSYSIVDMTLQGGLGDVTATKNDTLVSPVGEKLAALYNANGKDIWVMTHKWNSTAFYAYPVTAAGVGTPVVTYIGGSLSGPSEYVGQLKFSPDGKHLAMCAEDGYFAMFDFNDATGVVTNAVTDILSANNQTYGCEFSPDSRLVYISVNSPGQGQVYQYNLMAGTATDILASSTLITTAEHGICSLQLGPDKKIYCASLPTTYLHVINNPNVIGLGCNLQLQADSLFGTCNYGLPNFLASYFRTGDDVPTGISSTGTEAVNNVYPNPATRTVQLSFTLTQPQDMAFNIYDMKGTLVQPLQNTPCTTGENVFNFSTGSLAAGVYVFKAQGNKGAQFSRKVVKK